MTLLLLLFLVLVLGGLLGLHRSDRLQLHQHQWYGHSFGLLCWMACLGNRLRSFCHFWGCTKILHLYSLLIMRAREFQKKHLLLLYWLCQTLWLCGSQQTVENSSRDGNTRPPDLSLEKSVCRSRSNSLQWAWNNRQAPNQKRSMSRLYIVTLLI